MDLELRNVQVKDVVLGDKNDLKDGVLTVDVEGLKKLILEDPRVTAVKVDLAKPGESCRILPVKDVVEPRYKPEGEIFPGVFGSDVPVHALLQAEQRGAAPDQAGGCGSARA